MHCNLNTLYVYLISVICNAIVFNYFNFSNSFNSLFFINLPCLFRFLIYLERIDAFGNAIKQ